MGGGGGALVVDQAAHSSDFAASSIKEDEEDVWGSKAAIDVGIVVRTRRVRQTLVVGIAADHHLRKSPMSQ